MLIMENNIKGALSLSKRLKEIIKLSKDNKWITGLLLFELKRLIKLYDK